MKMTRKKQQVIVIGSGPGSIRLEIMDITGDQVVLNILVPDGVPVAKGEVMAAVERQRRVQPKQ